MTCPDDGILKAWVDVEPEAVPEHVGEHVATCGDCRQTVARQRQESAAAGSALALLAPPRPPDAAEVEAALGRIRPRPSASAAAPAAFAAPAPRPGRRWSWRPLAGAAAAALVFSVAGTPAGRSAASSFLGQFRSETVVPIAVNPGQDQAVLTDLAGLGRLSGNTNAPSPQRVGSVRAAAHRVGFPVLRADPATLPAGVADTPQVYVAAPRTVRFTFDRAKAEARLQREGAQGTVDLPERFDGASLVVSVPAAVMLEYPGAHGDPAVVLGQARQIQAHAEGGVSLAAMRSFLLDLPGLSERTRSQLAAIEDWRTTLPLPVPADQLHWERVDIAGTKALLLRDLAGLGSAAIWERQGRMYGVAALGAKGDREAVVRDVAAGLR